MTKIKFPVLAVILLLFGIAWTLNELSILIIDIPWVPVILVVVAIGMIANRYNQ